MRLRREKEIKESCDNALDAVLLMSPGWACGDPRCGAEAA